MFGAVAKALIAAMSLPCWLWMMPRHQKPVTGVLPSSTLVPPISLWYDNGWCVSAAVPRNRRFMFEALRRTLRQRQRLGMPIEVGVRTCQTSRASHPVKRRPIRESMTVPAFSRRRL